MKNINKKKIVLGIIAIITLTIVAGISYAATLKVLRGTKKYTVLSTGLKLYLDESKTIADVVDGTKVVPVTDDLGKETEGYYFSLVNEENYPIEYSIYLDEKEDNTMPTYGLRFNLLEENKKIDITGNIEDTGDIGNRLLTTQVISANTTHDYTLRIWLGMEAGNDAKNKTYSAKIRIEAEQAIPNYHETVLNGTDPVLTDNLVPVLIANDGTVTKADVEKEWYKYEEQRWANAIVLIDNTVSYNNGDIIPEDNIESYFVWIPRYRYQIFDKGSYTSLTTLDEGAVQTINIEFENKDTAVSTSTSVNGWLTHPAFTAFDSNGFWVGKFESGYNGATSKTGAEKNTSDASHLIIKPNVFSWRNIMIGYAFKVSYDYLREDESHMMKNTEWGAVAYLQHSAYGSRQNVRVNNNSNLKTGYAALVEPTCGSNGGTSISCNLVGTSTSQTLLYNTQIGYSASTTNNITGIYDMAGGSFENVMGYTTIATTIGGYSDITYVYPDFYTNTYWEKYYDKYTANSETAFNTRILGDATGEMGPFEEFTETGTGTYPRSSWYDDYGWFICDEYPWFERGGGYYDGYSAGIFAYADVTGINNTLSSFRVVLTPEKKVN